jgi:hypothetical protein
VQQPVLWLALSAVVVVAAAARLALRRPLLPSRAAPVPGVQLAVVAVAVVVLVFHCASMFFAGWTDALPGGRPLGEQVRDMGAVSQWAFWLPAVVLLVGLRRIWAPVLLILALVLAGVGVTMFWPFPLTVHLGWIAAAVVTLAGIGSALVRLPRNDAPAVVSGR